MNTVIYQIFYDDETRKHVDPACVPLYNHTATVTLENSVIANTVRTVDPAPDYLGILSWKFKQKIPLNITGKNSIAERMEADNYRSEVYTFFGSYHQSNRIKNMWQIAENWHPGIMDIAERLFNELGLGVSPRNMTGMPIVYFNGHVSRYDIYKRYVDELLAPALQIIEGDTDMHRDMFQQSRHRNALVSKERLLQVFGVDYYPLHPFVCERLFSTFLWMNNIKVKHIA